MINQISSFLTDIKPFFFVALRCFPRLWVGLEARGAGGQWTCLTRGARGPGSHQAEPLTTTTSTANSQLLGTAFPSLPPLGAAPLHHLFTREGMTDAAEQRCELPAGMWGIRFQSRVWIRQTRSCSHAVLSEHSHCRLSCWHENELLFSLGGGRVIKRWFLWST